MHNFDHLTLEQKVVQLFMVGFSGTQPGPVTRRFLEAGVGGVIFFRDNFDGLVPQTAVAVRDLLDSLRAAIPTSLPRPFFSIDQEGGQVERLPHTVFPTGVTPRAVALARQPEALADQLYETLAAHLAMLGFNMDFFPTLDVNFQHANPIIGVRSFGDDAQSVWPLTNRALSQFKKYGVVAVGKHFPGHGNGTVDSHYDLPVLNFTEEELAPFQNAIQAGLPAMLVSHGFYPALQTDPAEQNLPASASPIILQHVLRQRCGFEGVIITDDLCMGAITKQHGPVEAALLCLQAGADILLYKQSTDAEWAVYEAVLEAFRTGRLPEAHLNASLVRLLKLKAAVASSRDISDFGTTLNPSLPEAETTVTEGVALSLEVAFAPEKIQALAESIAWQAISILSQSQSDALPLRPNRPILLVAPDRGNLGNYAFDVPTSPDLPEHFATAGFTQMETLSYRFDDAMGRHFEKTVFNSVTQKPEVVVFVSFNPLINTAQVTLYNALKARFPQSRFIVASAGTPYDQDVLEGMDVHLALCSYRPATLKMLPRWLLQPEL